MTHRDRIAATAAAAPAASRARAVRARAPQPRARQAQPDQDAAHPRGADRRDAAADHLPAAVHLRLRRRDRRRLAARLPAVPAARACSPRRSRIGGVAIGVNLNTDIEKGVFDRFRSLPIARSAPLVGAVLGRHRPLRDRSASSSLGFGYVLGFRAADRARSRCSPRCLLAVAFALCLCWVSVFVGMIARTPGAVQGIMFLIVLPLTLRHAARSCRPTTMPGWLQTFVDVNPITHLVGAVRGLLLGGAADGLAPAVDARLDGRPAGRLRAARAAGLPPPRLSAAGTSRARAASRSSPEAARVRRAERVVAERLAQLGGERAAISRFAVVRRAAQHCGRAEHLRGVDGPARRRRAAPPRRPHRPRSACRASRPRRRRRRRAPRRRRRRRRRPARRAPMLVSAIARAWPRSGAAAEASRRPPRERVAQLARSAPGRRARHSEPGDAARRRRRPRRGRGRARRRRARACSRAPVEVAAAHPQLGQAHVDEDVLASGTPSSRVSAARLLERGRRRRRARRRSSSTPACETSTIADAPAVADLAEAARAPSRGPRASCARSPSFSASCARDQRRRRAHPRVGVLVAPRAAARRSRRGRRPSSDRIARTSTSGGQLDGVDAVQLGEHVGQHRAPRRRRRRGRCASATATTLRTISALGADRRRRRPAARARIQSSASAALPESTQNHSSSTREVQARRGVAGVAEAAQRGERCSRARRAAGANHADLLGARAGAARLARRARRSGARARARTASSSPASAEPLEPVLADRLEHPVARRRRRRRPAAASGRPARRAGRAPSTASSRRRARPRPLSRRHAAGEDREPLGERALGVGQQVPAPVDDRAQRAVARQRGAAAAGEQPEAVVEPRGELVERQRAQPRGGELDRQRQPVEPAADLDDRARRSPSSTAKPGAAAAARSANSSTAGCASASSTSASGRAGRAAAPRRAARRRCRAARGWWPGRAAAGSARAARRRARRRRRSGARSCRARASASRSASASSSAVVGVGGACRGAAPLEQRAPRAGRARRAPRARSRWPR